MYVPPVPLPANINPPAVAESSAQGSDIMFARADHTHASKVRKARIQSASDGTLTWTFSPPFTDGVVPRVLAVAETGQGVTDVINVQVEGTPTSTGCSLRVNRTQRSVVALIGLTVLSVPASPGATWVHAVALEP